MRDNVVMSLRGLPEGNLNNDSLPDLCFSTNQVNGRLSRNWGDWGETQDKKIPRSVGFETWGLGHRICLADGHRDGQLDVSAGQRPRSQHDLIRRRILFGTTLNDDNTEGFARTKKSEHQAGSLPSTTAHTQIPGPDRADWRCEPYSVEGSPRQSSHRLSPPAADRVPM